MNKYLKIYLNWRINAMALLAVTAIVLITSNCDSPLAFILTKVMGFLLGYLTYRFGRYWQDRGELKELELLDDED